MCGVARRSYTHFESDSFLFYLFILLEIFNEYSITLILRNNLLHESRLAIEVENCLSLDGSQDLPKPSCRIAPNKAPSVEDLKEL